MKPGVSGTTANRFGSRQNAGAGLFFTKSIACYSGGYFMLMSGSACYRLRQRRRGEQIKLFFDPFDDRHDLYDIPPWMGTVVAIDIHVKALKDFDRVLKDIRDAYFGTRKQSAFPKRKVRFT